MKKTQRNVPKFRPTLITHKPFKSLLYTLGLGFYNVNGLYHRLQSVYAHCIFHEKREEEEEGGGVTFRSQYIFEEEKTVNFNFYILHTTFDVVGTDITDRASIRH